MLSAASFAASFEEDVQGAKAQIASQQAGARIAAENDSSARVAAKTPEPRRAHELVSPQPYDDLAKATAAMRAAEAKLAAADFLVIDAGLSYNGCGGYGVCYNITYVTASETERAVYVLNSPQTYDTLADAAAALKKAKAKLEAAGFLIIDAGDTSNSGPGYAIAYVSKP